MSETPLTNDRLIQCYIDFSPNLPKCEQTREEFRQLLQNRFDRKLPDAIERMWKVPALMLHGPDDEYIDLLLQARELFIMGYFYSCVAMCGIVGERLVKDLLRASIFVSVGGDVKRPTDGAFDQFERVDVSTIVRFLNKTSLLSDDAKKAAEGLGELRNQYAHARGRNPQDDALESIQKLHTLIDGTVSVLKDFEIVDGKLVPKTISQTE